MWLWESTLRTRVLPDVGSGTLTTRLQVYGYAALATRRPKAISLVTGTGLIVPTFQQPRGRHRGGARAPLATQGEPPPAGPPAPTGGAVPAPGTASRTTLVRPDDQLFCPRAQSRLPILTTTLDM